MSCGLEGEFLRLPGEVTGVSIGGGGVLGEKGGRGGGGDGELTVG